jgi:predicted XRE-type DNA-binding protein
MKTPKASRPKPPKTRETSGPASELILYQTADGRTRIECRFEDETIWLSQALIAELFQVSVTRVNEHLRGIYEDGEIDGLATIRTFRIVRTEGNRRVSRDIEHYSLAAILGVGYRVRSGRGTLFRQWATSRLSEYLVKGFLLDDERLKDPDPNRTDYFDEVLERIRDIRSAEKRMYLKVKDIFALAADYKPDSARQSGKGVEGGGRSVGRRRVREVPCSPACVECGSGRKGRRSGSEVPPLERKRQVSLVLANPRGSLSAVRSSGQSKGPVKVGRVVVARGEAGSRPRAPRHSAEAATKALTVRSHRPARRPFFHERVYDKPGRYTVAVKVIDIFGNDTMTLVPVNVG